MPHTLTAAKRKVKGSNIPPLSPPLRSSYVNQAMPMAPAATTTVARCPRPPPPFCERLVAAVSARPLALAKLLNWRVSQAWCGG
jgi:hypothetical protein